MRKVASDRNISFREIHEAMFSKGRSTFLEEYSEPIGDNQSIERQFRIVGLTNSGRPLVVVFTPRDSFGVAKRIVTAWQVSRRSKEVRKLLTDCPHLQDQLKLS